MAVFFCLYLWGKCKWQILKSDENSLKIDTYVLHIKIVKMDLKFYQLIMYLYWFLTDLH